MKLKIVLILSIILINSTAKSQPYYLTVNNGLGSGFYDEGDTVHVWSHAVLADSVFVDWADEGSNFLEFNNEWHTTLVVPPGTGIGDFAVTANYDVIPSSTRIDSKSYLLFGEDSNVVTLEMKETYFAIPPAPKGIVFLLHGTGGEGASFFTKYERYNLVKDLVFNGFAAFTLDANEQTMGDQNGDENIRWDTFNPGFAEAANNIDIKNIEALRDSIIEDFNLSLGIPCFTFGMSAGAVFSDLCASALDFNASAHITAKGRTGTYTRPDIAPVIWIMAENDHNKSADNEAAFTNFTTMNATQNSEWQLFRRSPVYPKRFMRSLNGISEANSNSVFQRLQSSGFLDVAGMLTVLDVAQLPASLLDNLGLSPIQKYDIRRQLLMVNADHVLHSDFSKNTIRFFNQALPLSPIKEDVGEAIALAQNYPNPFNPSTTIRFSIPSTGHSSLKVFDVRGREVAEVVNKNLQAGEHSVLFEASHLASGVYYYKLSGLGVSKVRKFVLVK